MKKHKLEQERLARSTDEVLGAIKTMSNYTNMFEDFEKKLKTAEQMIERSVMHVDKRVLSVGDDFNNLRREFNNQNEAFRIAVSQKRTKYFDFSIQRTRVKRSSPISVKLFNLIFNLVQDDVINYALWLTLLYRFSV